MTRVLVLDIGNSFTKLACFVDEELAFTEHFPTEKEGFDASADDGLALPFAVDGVVVASVVPEARPMVERLIANAGAEALNRMLWLERAQYTELQLGPVDFSRYQAEALGADRLANAVAGAIQYPNQKVLVCDAGTTTTFEMVDETGVFLGGAICPGPVKFQSLVSGGHAAQLFEVDVFQKPMETPGLSTRTCLENGLHFGYKGAMLEIFGNLFVQAQWPLSQVAIVFTGGYAREVRDMLTLEIPQAHVDPGLTLTGLYRIWQENYNAPLLKAE